MKWCRRPQAATDDIRAVLDRNPGEDADMAADTLAAVVDDTEDRERSGIESTMSRLWATYKLPGGVRTAMSPNFSPAAFVKSKADTLFVAVPAFCDAFKDGEKVRFDLEPLRPFVEA